MTMTPTTPTTPTLPVTETFTGSVAQNGSAIHNFSTSRPAVRSPRR